MPELSDMEASILRTVYSAKGVATRLEIAAKLKAQQLSTAMLEFLVEKGVLEKTKSDSAEPEYKLTFAGKGCFVTPLPGFESRTSCELIF